MKHPPTAPESRAPADVDADASAAATDHETGTVNAVLVRLLQETVSAEARREGPPSNLLVAANEQLVVAALRSQAEAAEARQVAADATLATMVDALTGLHNRQALVERFSQVVAQARRHGKRCALLFVDLDGFKRLNDSRGHAFGDRVLRRVAERMVGAVREVDTVSRHGGDEFLILLADLTQASDAQAVADKVVSAIGAPMALDGEDFVVTASAGIALYPDDGEDVGTLVECADKAMYASKQRQLREYGSGRSAPGPASTPAPVDPERRLADLREANEKLVLAILKSEELRAAAERARKRQTAFLNAVAAELRDPQAPVRIASDMLGHGQGQEPVLTRVQKAVEQRMAHMARLVGDLVETARSESGDLLLNRRPVEMAAAVDAAIAAQRPVLERRGLRLGWRRPAERIDCDVDPMRLQQILANLIDNACAHTPDGGHIDLSVDANDDTVMLTVADDGVGIAPQALPQVFEPFARTLAALDADAPSLGLGLTAVRALVQAHGGTVTAYSAGLHRGSRFVITLPRSP